MNGWTGDYADALSNEFTVHLWDMPRNGASSKHDRVDFDAPGKVFTALPDRWL